MANGTEVTDGQIYNYIAKGGTSESDILVESKVPDYTVIEKKADIGIKLPVMKVNTPTQTGAEVKYAVTDNGVIFIWPPFPHEEKYYVNENETVDADVISSSGELEIKVADKLLKIESNEDGEIQTKEIIYDGLTRKEFDEIKEKVKVGDFVDYPLSEVTIQTDPSKTGCSSETLTTDTSAKWRILSIDEDTGKVLITTQGPVNKVTLQGATGYLFGANELHRLCEKLYSNTSKNLVAKSMTIEDLNKACGYIPPTENEQLRYAWYPADTPDGELKPVEAGGKVYTAKRHTASLAAGIYNPKFYTWDDENGVIHIAKDENDYKELKTVNEPILTSKTYYWYNPQVKNTVVDSILGKTNAEVGYLASPCVNLFEDKDSVNYEIFNALHNHAGSNGLCYSNIAASVPKIGLRPVISFNINRLDISDTTKTGAESASWEIK